MRWALALPLLSACGVGSSVAVSGAPCPCAEDQFCCPLTQVCALEPTLCPEPVRFDRVSPSAGAASGGYELRVFGVGFDLVAEVEVGGAPCAGLERRADVELRCWAPKGPAWGGAADVRLLGAGAQVLAAGEGAFRYARPGFVDRAAPWGFRRPRAGGGASLLRVGVTGRPWLFFGAEGVDAAGGGPPALEAPDAWRWADGAYERAPFGEVEAMSSLLLADFDNDGRTEALAGPVDGRDSAPDGVARMFEVAGPEQIRPVEADIGPHRHFLPIDLDGDHDIDLVACDPFGSPPLAVFRNLASDGGEGFERTTIDIVSDGCGALQAGDLDGDLRPELFLAGASPRLFRVEGGGRLDLTEDRVLSEDLRRVAFALSTAHFVDFDLDGHQDLALIGRGAVDFRASGSREARRSGMLLFSNQAGEGDGARLELAARLDLPGPDSFGCPSDFDGRMDASLRWGLGTALWFDADLDGDVDALVPTLSGRCVFGPGLYINRTDEGRPGFTMHALQTDWFYLASVGGAAGDIDGDGDLDVVFNQGALGARAVLENQLAQRVGGTTRHLVVRPISDPDGDATDPETGDDRLEPSVVVQIDLDGDDFEPDALRRSQTTGGMGGELSQGLFEAHFGLGAHQASVWVRTRFPDGSLAVRELPPGQTLVELRDCADERC